MPEECEGKLSVVADATEPFVDDLLCLSNGVQAEIGELGSFEIASSAEGGSESAAMWLRSLRSGVRDRLTGMNLHVFGHENHHCNLSARHRPRGVHNSMANMPSSSYATVTLRSESVYLCPIS
jgi:hypothetical protein